MMTFVAALACCMIRGNVHSISSVPLSGVRIELRAATATSIYTNAKGHFSVTVPRGTYQFAAVARGFASITTTVSADHNVQVQVTLEPLDSPKLRTIGQVAIDGRLARIRGTMPAISLSRLDFDLLGDNRIIEGLQYLPEATFTRPDGGPQSAVAVVSLRGPDPSESLLTLDGQLLNDGNTGDLDLSRFPVGAFSEVDVTEGLGPEDSKGSNTFGGAINLISLHPTRERHSALSLSDGSFGQSEAWVNATGTQG